MIKISWSNPPENIIGFYSKLLMCTTVYANLHSGKNCGKNKKKSLTSLFFFSTLLNGMFPAIPVLQDGVKGHNTKETTLPGSPALQGVELHKVVFYVRSLNGDSPLNEERDPAKNGV